MTRDGKITVWLLFLLVPALRVAGADSEPPFVAFSIREACRLTKVGQTSELLASLGDLTRIGALVYDPDAKDLILIGLAAQSLPEARWDDLVVAFRARILHDEFPLVSIDPTENTPRTKRQAVSFVGHLEDTKFGEDLLTCDVLLKRYSLELEEVPQTLGLPSYRSLIEQAVRADARRQGAEIVRFQWHAGDASRSYCGMASSTPRVYQARFWYKRSERYEAFCRPSTDRPEVFRIDQLALMIDSERVLGKETEANRKCRESFAAQWTNKFPEVCNKFVPLRKLKVLYDLTAVADAVRHLHQHVELPYLDYLLDDYQTSPAKTLAAYPLEEMTGVGKRDDAATELVYVSGGIELAPYMETIKNLNAGSVFGLRELTLESRPSPDALTWEPPLAGWRMPNACDLIEHSEGGEQSKGGPAINIKPQASPGCYLHAQSVTLRPPGGAQEADAAKLFRGFSFPAFQLRGLPKDVPAYKWNGVLIDPKVEKDAIPLSKDVRQKVIEIQRRAKGPVSDIDIPPLEIEDEEFQGVPKR